MKVKLLAYTQNPIDIMWTAARTCYSEKSPIKMWDYDRYDETQDEIDRGLCMTEVYIKERQNKMWKLVKKYWIADINLSQNMFISRLQ